MAAALLGVVASGGLFVFMLSDVLGQRLVDVLDWDTAVMFAGTRVGNGILALRVLRRARGRPARRAKGR